MSLAGVPRDERTNILGVCVNSINLDDAVATIERWISERSQNYVCVTDVHGLMEGRSDEQLRSIYNEAGMATPDGMPLVWLSRLFGKSRTERVYGPDLMRMMTAVSTLRGYRQFYYGGAEGVADKLKEALIADYPGLEVAGSLSPPFRELTFEEDQAIVDIINAAHPDIVWVGLGAPKQEFWMANHLGRIKAPVMIGVGAAFDFLAGTKPQAPLWMQRNGLEWLFRLCSEPRRLWPPLCRHRAGIHGASCRGTYTPCPSTVRRNSCRVAVSEINRPDCPSQRTSMETPPLRAAFYHPQTTEATIG